MSDKPKFPVPRTATDTYLAAIFDRLGEVLDRLPEPPPALPDEGEVELREPVVSPARETLPASRPEPEPKPEREIAPEVQAPPAAPEEGQAVAVDLEPAPGEEQPANDSEELLPPAEDTEAGAPLPSVRDPKQAWIDYAHARGVDTDGMTKQQLIDRFRD